MRQTDERLALRRTQVWYGLIILVFAVCLLRLFYLQVIRHSYYVGAAQSDQYKEYVIPAARGAIRAYDGDTVVPIVLSQQLFTIYADPELIKDPAKSAATLADIIGGDTRAYEDKMKREGRYVILAKKISTEQKDKLLAKKLPGVGAQAQDYRTYPQGTLAAQILGFVDDAGVGRYGIEQTLHKQLSGVNGELKAVTDINGVPLAASEDNVRKAPVDGDDVVLTIDIGMQKQVEKILKEKLEAAKSDSGSAVIIEANSGAVKAMANYPSYDPANYSEVTDAALFSNSAIDAPIEVGSVMKPLTAAAALNMGVVQADTTYYDPQKIKIDDRTVSNIEEDGGPGVKNISQILNLSLNTGATWLLMQMGGGELNQKGRSAWYDYMTKNFRFGKETGIEQGYEATGFVPSPSEGFGLNITYANTSFGQAMTATTLQMASAYAAVLNGGTYYQPTLVSATVDAAGKTTLKEPTVLQKNVVSATTSKQIQGMLEYVVANHRFNPKFSSAYSVGGKTGTAQIADLQNGGYYENDYNGTYVGFVGGNDAQYIIAVEVNKPKIAGYAGSAAAQPLFGAIAHSLIDNFNVSTKQ